jgi:hypothetical protein
MSDQPKDEKDEKNEQPPLDTPQPGERVYAPASARVAKPPAPGHEALVRQVDDSTPERRAADESAPAGRAVDDTREGSQDERAD